MTAESEVKLSNTR